LDKYSIGLRCSLGDLLQDQKVQVITVQGNSIIWFIKKECGNQDQESTTVKRNDLAKNAPCSFQIGGRDFAVFTETVKNTMESILNRFFSFDRVGK